MKTESRAYSNATYEEFLAIESGEYKEKVQFVNLNRDTLNTLSLKEYVRVMNAYAEALFELGRFAAHIEVADDLIETSIVHNVRKVGEKDLYQDTLFQKAASLYNLEQLDSAIHILHELLKINPDNASARLFLINCHVSEHRTTLQTVRMASIVMVLLSACVIAFELLYVRPRNPEMAAVVELTRNLMFLCGVGILIAGELLVRYQAMMALRRFSSKRKRV